jgi:hypothetical protein
MIRRVVNRIESIKLDFIYKLLSGNIEFHCSEAMIVSGDPRGGTTWMAELINSLTDVAMIWEPLAVSEVKQFRNLEFQWRQYIPEEDCWPEAKIEFDRLFSGQMLSSYLCQRTSPEELKRAKHLLVKFCRANQLLPWLTKEFQFRYSPIYIVRHPCAVVASQLKQGGWSHVMPDFEIPEGRYNSFYSDHSDFLKTIDTVEKRLAATWCLCNQVPLNHPENNTRWITVTYESMLLNGSDQLKRIENRWGLFFPDEVYSKVLQASATTVSGSPIMDGKVKGQLSYWKNQLTANQIDNVLVVLDYFKVKLYSSDELPHITFTG